MAHSPILLLQPHLSLPLPPCATAYPRYQVPPIPLARTEWNSAAGEVVFVLGGLKWKSVHLPLVAAAAIAVMLGHYTWLLLPPWWCRSSTADLSSSAPSKLEPRAGDPLTYPLLC